MSSAKEHSFIMYCTINEKRLEMHYDIHYSLDPVWISV